ncbi:GNAT family N-acetyltransferase [Marinibaculum pumilum]|uniref:GNAT family N-acetyltransferase n=1 Tax=Marinibaculum pumilum TaxID=1766165 RepID=A0ABV7KWN6_9PROT
MRPDGLFDVTVTFLEMAARPSRSLPHPPQGRRLTLIRAEQPPLHFYRYLYDTVGRDWYWIERKRLSDTALAEIVRHPEVHIYLLLSAGVPAGFVEIDYRRLPEQTAIAYFGLVPEFQGGGLGRYFLEWSIDAAWSRGPAKVILNTCDLDHPGALPLYQKCGFVPVSQKRIVFDPVP